VKFFRQFGAAVAVVTVVVLIGLAWNHLAPSLPGEGPAGRAFAVPEHAVKGLRPAVRLAPGGKLAPGGRLPPAGAGIRYNDGSGGPGLFLGDLLQPVNLAVLRSTAFLEAAVIAAVVILDAGYRRLRRARRGGRGWHRRTQRDRLPHAGPGH